MKILYLDFDGCIITQQSIVRARKENLDLDQCLDPFAVANLNYILSTMPEVRIVISSAWRLECTLAELKEILALNGMTFPHRVIGVTPSLKDGRGEEIKAWLGENGQLVTAFAIVDDLAHEMGHLTKFLVQTNPVVGLTWNDSQKILDLLNDRSQLDQIKTWLNIG